MESVKQYFKVLRGMKMINFRTGFKKKSHLATVSTRKTTNSFSVTDEQIKPFEAIPGPTGLPYIGSLWQYTLSGRFSVAKYHLALLDRYKQYGPIVKETIAGNTVIHVFDPQYIKILYGIEGKSPYICPLLEAAMVYRKENNKSPGLGNINGDEWYRLRTNVNQSMMKPKAANSFLPGVNQVADDFISFIKSTRNPNTNEMENFANDISKYNLESSIMTCFEKRFGSFEAGPGSCQQSMIDAVRNMFTMSTKIKFGLPWFKLGHWASPSFRKLIDSEVYLFSVTESLLEESIDCINNLKKNCKEESNRYQFLRHLLAKDDLAYSDLVVIAMSLFSDGISATGPSLTGQLYCIASNPEKQEKLYEEICNLTPPVSQKPITDEIISAASYLKACVKEGFRFFPVGTEISRIPQKDVVLGGYHIPAGTNVDINNNTLLRLEEHFENPESYIPERWVRGGSAQNTHPYLLIPFGHGPRTCVGRRFAEQEMKVLIIKLLQNFRLECDGVGKMEQSYNILLNPDIPCRIKFIPRM